MEMKKIIAISIVTSAVLFGAGVTDLSVDQINLGTNSDISHAIINQGTVDVSDGTGSTTVDDYNHGGHSGEGANENTIDNTDINGLPNSTGAITVDQGRLKITNGATVTNSNDHSENNIEDGRIDATAGSNVTVTQGNIDINSATYDNMEVHSKNDIIDVDIDANGGKNTEVTQATLVVDSNLTGGTDADYTKISTTNKFEHGTIINSTVKQAHTEIKSGATVYGLDIDQTNTINTLNTDDSDINGSKVLQGITKIDGTGTNVINLKIDTINNINGVDAFNNSNIVQNHINIHSGSSATNLTVKSDVNHNTISKVDADNSDLYQGTINMTEHSSVNGLTITHNNKISTSNLENTHVGQDVLDLNNSILSNGVSIAHINKIDDISSIGTENELHQGFIVVDSSNLNGTTSFKSNNTIEHVNLNDANITQSYVSLIDNGDMDTIKLDNLNIVSGIDVTGSDMNSSSVSQAELLMTGVTMNGDFEQYTRNEIEHVQISDSTVAQAKVDIGNSTIRIHLGTNAQKITNDIDSPSISNNSKVSQNGLKICNSTVTDLTVGQDNDLNGGDIVDSTFIQGDINIEGSGQACVFAKAEHTHKY